MRLVNGEYCDAMFSRNVRFHLMCSVNVVTYFNCLPWLLSLRSYSLTHWGLVMPTNARETGCHWFGWCGLFVWYRTAKPLTEPMLGCGQFKEYRDWSFREKNHLQYLSHFDKVPICGMRSVLSRTLTFAYRQQTLNGHHVNWYIIDAGFVESRNFIIWCCPVTNYHSKCREISQDLVGHFEWSHLVSES